jgi:2-methylcitrate dehydratase PrpD
LTYVVEGQRSPNHITETSALTALAVGEAKRISGKDMIAAMVVGDDLAARLHLSVDRPQPGQALSAGTAPPPAARGSEEAFAATTIAGRIMGLASPQMRNALGIATLLGGGGGGGAMGVSVRPSTDMAPARTEVSATQTIRGLSPGWKGINDPRFVATMEMATQVDTEKNVGTKLSNGLTARRGINAAQLALAGWPGVNDPFFGENGGHFPGGVASIHHPEWFTRELGREYIVEVCFKPYPGGRPTGAPTTAALALARKHQINTDDIAEVILHLSPQATAQHYATPYAIGAYPTMNALWSYYFVVASALYRRSATAENFTEDNIRDPRLQALIKKVKLGYLDKPRGVELEVVMRDGRRFSECYETALGDPENPMSRDDLVAKFMEQLEFSRLVTSDKAEELVELVENLESVADVSAIAKLAASDHGSPKGSAL